MLAAVRQLTRMAWCWRIDSLEANRDEKQCKRNSEGGRADCGGILG